MRLYSRKQLIFYSILSGAVVFLIAIVIGLFGRSSKTDDIRAMEYQPPSATPVQMDDTLLSLSSSDFSEDEKQNILIYKSLNEAVVNITTISFSYSRWYFEPVPQEGTGSGTIIDPAGIILTNYHVIKGAEELFVTLADGTDYDGKLIGQDIENDLAIVQIDPKGKILATIPFGDSSNLLVGQKVLAIGNPFAFDRTFTTGIVSGVGRPVRTNEGIIIKEMIQTDASINPGNSGGPLLNGRGEMIGINTMIFSPTGGSVGIGFAVPINTAKRIMPELLRYGRVRRGWIDVEPVQLFPQLVRYANLTISEGVLISEVETGSNAEKAGLKGGSRQRPVRVGRQVIYLGGDIIVAVDDIVVKTLMDLYSALEDTKPGDVVEVKVIRGRSEKTLEIKLSERSS